MGRFVCSCYNHNVSHHASFLLSRHPPSFAPRLLPASYLHPAHGIDPTHSLVASLTSKRPWELQDARHISTYLQTGISIKPAPGCRMLWNLASARNLCTRYPSRSAGHRPYSSARNSQSRLPSSSPVLGGTGSPLAEKLRQHRLSYRVHVRRCMPQWIFCTPATATDFFSSPIFGDSTAPVSAALSRRPALTARHTPHVTILLSHVAPLSHLHPLCTHRHPASLRPHIPPVLPYPPSLHSRSNLLLLLARAMPPCTGSLLQQALRSRRSSPARVFVCLLFSCVLTICDTPSLPLRDAVLYLLPLILW
ncbi:hypothetical protein C8R45DRAFT_966063 [Mycena sanguinolenta]|nr:hypothetical protein C8R45DRAFT_966063 [Mycena sanguinolenta]